MPLITFINKLDRIGINEYDIHINFRENAIFKDGPSAGITITTVLLSYLLNKEIPKNISMTGEITLKGDILPIGGVKEKTLAALDAGIDTIYLPYENKKDINSLDKDIRSKINYVFVKNYKEIFESIFNK
jgi:ATP-dependent Lon protease